MRRVAAGKCEVAGVTVGVLVRSRAWCGGSLDHMREARRLSPVILLQQARVNRRSALTAEGRSQPLTPSPHS
jgi:hypothetical protein